MKRSMTNVQGLRISIKEPNLPSIGQSYQNTLRKKQEQSQIISVPAMDSNRFKTEPLQLPAFLNQSPYLLKSEMIKEQIHKNINIQKLKSDVAKKLSENYDLKIKKDALKAIESYMIYIMFLIKTVEGSKKETLNELISRNQ